MPLPKDSLPRRATNILDVTRVRASAYQDSLRETDAHNEIAKTGNAWQRIRDQTRTCGDEIADSLHSTATPARAAPMTSAGFWAAWLPFALPQCWPFAARRPLA